MNSKTKKTALALALLMATSSLSGCLLAAVGAGYVIGEEITEDDGDFDPLDELDD